MQTFENSKLCVDSGKIGNVIRTGKRFQLKSETRLKITNLQTVIFDNLVWTHSYDTAFNVFGQPENTKPNQHWNLSPSQRSKVKCL